MTVHTVSYFGFVLARDSEPLANPFPPDLADAARGALVQALLAGETPHPDQGRARRALDPFGFYWRPSGGRLAQAATAQGAPQLGPQLLRIRSSQPFHNPPPTPYPPP